MRISDWSSDVCSSDLVALARTIVTVPINPEFGSLNLAQAVMVVAYEWSKGMDLTSPPGTDLDPPAPQDEFEGMFVQLDARLDGWAFFHTPERTSAPRHTLRHMRTPPAGTSPELRPLRG